MSPPAASEPRGHVIGTAGHVDHGKTSLVRALTGVDTDRWKEERDRGLTIDLGFARLVLNGEVEVGVVDVPGHEDFLKNMLAGATGVDLLLLVVAADEGPMPQTWEHLAIAGLLGVERGVVALSKADRVDPEWLELARAATRDLLATLPGGDGWPIVPVSAVSGEGLDALREALRAEVASAPARSTDDLFRLPVDRGFSIHGTGTVVTGTVWSGRVSEGDALRLLPGDRAVRVRALQVHGEGRTCVPAGRRCALALVGADPGDAPRGSVLVGDPAWHEVDRLGVCLRVLRRPGRSIEHGQRVRVYHGTREAMARVYLAAQEALPPGGEAWAVVALESPLVARVGDRFIVRFYSPVTTI
ncbi:MAG: selenocysteine-specific translation elongation factor, partial [Gemmatimonadota bacterium]